VIEKLIMAAIKKNKAPNLRRGLFYRQLIKMLLLTAVFWFPLRGRLFAHPMPNSAVVLNVHEKYISGEILLPLGELQSAIGMSVNDKSERLIERLGDSLRLYLMAHIRPKSFEGKAWTVELGEMKVVETKSKLTGDYKELVVNFSMTPPLHYDLRNFYFDYDVILHQVASHQILVNVKQDWQQGIVVEDSSLQQIGVIELDVPTNKIPVFQVSLQQGSTWTGFKSMVKLGMKHIAEGTDHLLFLLTLLLAAVQPPNSRRRDFKKLYIRRLGGYFESWAAILKIVTAFTIGHSLTLILASLKIVQLPSQPIEILIAISILVSAIHVIRPIFAGKEVFIAAGFGLIHGLAFADTIAKLELSTQQMVLSILGFNVGIELMQLCIIVLIVPLLIWLSKTQYYTIFRTIASILASIAALFWMVERVMGY
jgi:hypothetical protein